MSEKTDEELFDEEAKTLAMQIYGLQGLPPSSREHGFFLIKNALYAAFCDGVAVDQNRVVEDLCQAKAGDSGADGIAPAYAAALQSGCVNHSPEVAIDYTNWRGERRIRKVVPKRIRFGVSGWHVDPQWLLQAIDAESGDGREFAMNDIHAWGEATIAKSQGEERSDEVDPENKSASLTQNRNSIIEQCAKLIDELANDAFDTSTHSRDAMTIYAYDTVSTAFHAAAKELRSLKSPSSEPKTAGDDPDTGRKLHAR